MAMFAEAMNLTPGSNADASAAPAAADDRNGRPREPVAEPVRRDLGSIRREQPAASAVAAPAAQPPGGVRTIRDRLQPR